ncbi:hypothetical protein [Hyphomicrobium sp. 99]|uniref:hypothetical protein n=1 Tax=Hyphomicrobium sp. 99 TaxID=1163419 RepID=UPI0005F7E36A|nr:hypothetical protein [Hyphomicrobium sp. 99]
MKKVIIAAAVILGSVGSASAQSNTAPPASGNPDSMVRMPPSSSNGSGSGASGNVGSPTPNYPGRLRDYNSPSTDFSPTNRTFGLPRR